MRITVQTSLGTRIINCCDSFETFVGEEFTVGGELVKVIGLDKCLVAPSIVILEPVTEGEQLSLF